MEPDRPHLDTYRVRSSEIETLDYSLSEAYCVAFTTTVGEEKESPDQCRPGLVAAGI
jgi:hypothetical protein